MNDKPLDLDAIQARATTIPPPPWHAGRTVGRTVYCGEGADDLIGVMDTRALAEFVAQARTDVPALVAECRRLTAAVAQAETMLAETRDSEATLAFEVVGTKAALAQAEQERKALGVEYHALEADAIQCSVELEAAQARVAALEAVAIIAQRCAGHSPHCACGLCSALAALPPREEAP